MSFHGGLAGILIAAYVESRRKPVSFLRLCDMGAVGTPVGILAGRLANFVNGELWGRPTSLPWGVVFPGAGPLPRHPSQLYEAFLEGLVLLTVLLVLSRRIRPDGEMLGLVPHPLRHLPDLRRVRAAARRAARVHRRTLHHGPAAERAAAPFRDVARVESPAQSWTRQRIARERRGREACGVSCARSPHASATSRDRHVAGTERSHLPAEAPAASILRTSIEDTTRSGPSGRGRCTAGDPAGGRCGAGSMASGTAFASTCAHGRVA